MTYIIGKSFTFSASHRLDGLPDDHQCSRLHGHNYAVWLELAAVGLDPAGMVVDFGELRDFRDHLDARFDHRHLNDVMSGNPTAENLARHLFEVAAEMFGLAAAAVTVWETATCWARYRR